ncbi:hypothetical protein N7491_009105 [Penicillium cf. griseofulvum]|uniref:Uncharacterized protein n=1 Tax=Penicillium cf. griseofulvum TaxID=2972120 RepID=A0A9W9MF13_9EURO|nr:hypothetical protein N7472_005299 [Penicillium cf. griseofulvum]KAJ5423889.1 hypothetical protein N7491_009105 [Penicillium cf. griseofulvum]KAJ5430857.1 hypothetical protein N7445_008589 [Penicillium cf. griseofulvum]
MSRFSCHPPEILIIGGGVMRLFLTRPAPSYNIPNALQLLHQSPALLQRHVGSLMGTSGTVTQEHLHIAET